MQYPYLSRVDECIWLYKLVEQCQDRLECLRKSMTCEEKEIANGIIHKMIKDKTDD